MKALTLRNPWPWAVAAGLKGVENRGWAPPAELIGHDIAIHAGKGEDDVVFPVTEANRRFLAACRQQHPDVSARGAVVAVVTIAGCHADGAEPECGAQICSPWAVEGERHWQLSNVRKLAEPVTCRGERGLWDLPGDVESEVRAQLARKAEPPMETPKQIADELFRRAFGHGP